MLSLIKIEGAPENSVSYLAVNSHLTEVFSDLSSQPSIRLEEHSNLKIIVKSPSDKQIGSVTIHTSLLLPDIPQWLPLSNSSNILKTLPEKTYHPRILVLYCTEHLPAVQEVTENSSNECCNTDEFWAIHEQNNVLREKVSELENHILERKWEHLEKLHENIHLNIEINENFSTEYEKIKLKCETLEIVKKELDDKSSSLEVLYKQERYQREYLEKQVNKITLDFEELLQGECKKTGEYKNEVNELNEKLKIFQEKVAVLGCKLKEAENERDEAKRSLVIGKNLEYGCEKCKILQVLQEKFEESEFQRKILKEKLEELSEVKFDNKSAKWNNEKCLFLIEEYSKFKDFQLKTNKKINTLESELERKQYKLKKAEKKAEISKENNEKSQKISELLNSLQDKDLEIARLSNIVQSKDSEIRTSQLFSENIKKAKDGLESTVELLTEQIKILSEKLALAKQKNFELSNSEKEKQADLSKLTSDNADERFSEYIKNYGVEHHFERVAEGVYSFGSKKVSITLKNGYLVCRVGGGYMMIEEFLKLFVGTEEKIDEEEGHKRHLSALLSPGNYSNRTGCKRLDCDSEGTLTDRGIEIEYNYSNPINGLKENVDASPSRHKQSPTSRTRTFTPLRKGLNKRVFK